MPIKTEGIVVHAAGDPWKIEEITLSDLADDEILVEMVAGGVCHTDIKTGHGKFSITPPIVLGHEGVGRVKDANKSSNRFTEGDAVVLSYASCSRCDLCQSGYASNCELLSNYNFDGKRRAGASTKNGSSSYITLTKDDSHLNGNFFGQSSFSRLAIVNISCAVKVDVQDNEELKKLVLGCAFQTGAGSILNVCQPKVHSTIAIWGCGGVGLSAIMAAKLTSPAALIAIDISAPKLELATKYGATHTIDPSNLSPDQVRERILEITARKGVNFALDCVGNPGILSLGHRCLASRGMLVTVGGTPQPVSFVPSQALQKGLVYRGCHQGDSVPGVFIPKLMELWRKGSFPFDDVLSFYKFEDYEKALHDLESGKAIKPVLVF